MLIALYLLGYHWMSDAFSVIPVILCLGLTISAIIDKCYNQAGSVAEYLFGVQKKD